MSYKAYNDMLGMMYDTYHLPRLFYPSFGEADNFFKGLGKLKQHRKLYVVRLFPESSKDELAWKFDYETVPLVEGISRLYDNPPDVNEIKSAVEEYKASKFVVGANTEPFLRELAQSVGIQYNDLAKYANDISIWPDEKIMITYTPRDKYIRCPPHYIRNSGVMISTTLGKFIKKLFDVPDEKVEHLVDRAKAFLLGGNVIMALVSGDDIRHYYHQSAYHPSADLGDLRNSCMRYDACKNFFDLYTKNSQVQMAVAVRDGCLIGRSIVWTDEKGRKYYDRVYGARMTQMVLMGWMKEQGIRDTSALRGAVIKLDNADFRHYPYCDTMRYLSKKDKIVAHGPYVNNKKLGFLLQRTDGNASAY